MRSEQLLIYQSKRLPTDHFEIEQLQQALKIRKFLDAIKEKALVRSYASIDEFRTLLTAHLATVIGKLLTERALPPPSITRPPSFATPYSPIGLPPDLLVRESYLEKIRACLEPENPENHDESRVCILCGPSGSGKSTLAKQYFDSSAAKKIWVTCKSTLEYDAQALDLSNADLVVLDGFEDRAFCKQALRRINSRVRLLVTTTDCKSWLPELRALRTWRDSSRVDVGGLDRSEWNAVLATIAGGTFSQIFGALSEQFGGSVAGLRLLRVAVAQHIDPRRNLEWMRVKLQSSATVAADDRVEPRHDPAAFAAREWWKKNEKVGGVLWALSCVPLLGMSSPTLAEVLDRDGTDIDTDLSVLEHEAFIYPLWFGNEKVWVPLDYFRTVFESIDLFRSEGWDLQIFRERYLRHCESSNGILEKLDAVFVRASCAFESRNLFIIARELELCMDALSRLKKEQAVQESHWIPIAHALSQRARLCNQVIPIANNLTYLRADPDLGDLAWRMGDIDDFWAASAAAFAAVRHWSASPFGCEHAEKIRTRLRNLLQSDKWFSSNGAIQCADMLPAVLLGGLRILDSDKSARTELEWKQFDVRFPRSTFLHVAPIIRAADRGSYAELESLISLYWRRVRGGTIKEFVAEYVRKTCPGVAVPSPEGSDWQPPYDYRLAAAQIAFSIRAIRFLDRELPLKPSRFKDDKAAVNLFGNHDWMLEPK